MAKARHYELNELIAAEHTFSGQAELIVRAMIDKPGSTCKEITDVVTPKLTTRQDPLRVVSFYLSTWKRSGLVSVVDAPEGSGSEPEIDPVVGPAATAEVLPGATGEDDFDYAKATLRDAVLKVVELDGASTPIEISERLQTWGRTVTAKQVADACRKLADRKALYRSSDGHFDLTEAVVEVGAAR